MGTPAGQQVKLALAPRAVLEAERAAQWWGENRPAARELFDTEFRAALDQIRSAPRLGVVYEVVDGREHRRVLMSETGYHVYYRVVSPDLVRVVAVWSAFRGRRPRL